MKYFMITAFLYLFLSCNKKIDYKEIKPFFAIKKELISVKHLSNEIMHPDFLTRTGNVLAIASIKSDSMLFYYQVPEMTLIEKTGIKGNAPNEFSAFPMFCHTQTNNELYIWGYTPGTIKKFTLNNEEKLDYNKAYNIDYEAFNFMHIIDDSLLIYYIPDNLEIKKYDLKNNVLLDKINLLMDSHNESYFYTNRGIIIANNSSIVHSYLFKHRIDIYDIETLELKTVIQDSSDNAKIVLGDFENVTYHYVNLVAGEKYFYAQYSGKNNNEDPTGNQRKIEVYDYSGNPIIEYTFDVPPMLYTVDEKNQMIYGFNNNFEDFLLCYKIQLM